MNCSNCGVEATPGQKFCSNCGSRLAAACPTCGAPYAPGARFCGECGTSLQPQAQDGAPAAAPANAGEPVEPATAGQAPVAERRLVTILFADLVGFTAIAESRDAEQVRELLSGYFETARAIVGRYGGTIEKFIGDAVMAVWGAPTAHEDDAERAVRAALDLVEAVEALGGGPRPAAADGAPAATDLAPTAEGQPPRLQLRAAVLTGEAAVTLGAEGQGMVAGDLVNTASRLQSVAPPGSVLAGQQTRDAASGAIAFEEVAEQQLKGKALPVRAWRAVRVVAGLGGAGRYTGLEPPFEGRSDELRLIKDLFHATVRERRARLVTIIGQAGTGKSRLTREFEKYTDGLAEIVYWHVGRSPSYGEGITFWALGEMVRKRAGLAERDDDRTTRQQIAATLDAFVADEADRRWIEPRLLQLLGVGEWRTSEREELFGAWRMFFERIAEKGPVVMAFEDLESADPGTLDFIEYVIEWSRSQPIFILALTRPDLLERRPDWGAGQRNYTAVGLEPLSEQAMRDAVGGLVPGLPEKAMRAIVSRAEGVPLYAVETVRMLLNEGRLVEEEGVYRPVGDLTELEVPNTLHALIAARLDALDPQDRAVLQYAAVLGHTFTAAALAGVSGLPLDELDAQLRTLVRREVLELNADPRSPERGQYAFVQGLVREVAYSTLTKRDRRSRHLAAARYFEALGDEELAGALAMHYLDAWKAAPDGPDGDAIAAQARVALRAAAERAAGLHSPAQALSYLQHLLGVTKAPAERAATLERAAAVAEMAGLFETLDEYGREAVELYRQLGETGALARAAALVGRGHLGWGRLKEGAELVEEIMAEVGELEDEPGVIELIATLARLRALSGDNETAIALADRALVAAERLDLVEVIAGAVMTKGVSLAYLHRNREALILLPGVLHLAEAHGLILIEARARLNISQFHMVDEPVVALNIARTGTERAQKLGLRHWELLLAGNAVQAAVHTGDWDWALRFCAEIMRDDKMTDDTIEVEAHPATIAALRGDSGRLAGVVEAFGPIAAQSVDPQYSSLLLLLAKWLALCQGELRRVADEVVEMSLAEPTYGSATYVLAGHAALWLRDLDRARRLSEVVNRLSVRGIWIDAARRALSAGAAALEGRTADARARFAESTRQLRDHGMPLDLALVLMDQVAGLGMEDQTAQAAADEARDILERLRATVLLEQLDALTGSVPPAATTAASRARTEVGQAVRR